MKLHELVTQYVTYRKSLGAKFLTNEQYLKAFCKSIGSDIDIKQIPEYAVHLFLYGNDAKVTSGWFVKHSALLGFYQYALTRTYVETIPLPHTLPKRPSHFVPYIYSKKELRQLLDAVFCYQKNKSNVQPYMVRMILLLLYSTGLRVGEALALKLNDLDLTQHLITVHDSKCYKTRITPIGEQISQALNDYLLWRRKRGLVCKHDAPLFVGKNNLPFNVSTLNHIFRRIRKKAGIVRLDKGNVQPRIHDLRHTFAVHHLISWYQEKKDVGTLLPILSTYMGHSSLAHTTVYLSMTDELLNEAGIKFEKYALGENK